MEDKTILACVAIGAISVLEGIAMVCGIDGTTLAGAIGIIAGLGGYVAGRIQEK